MGKFCVSFRMELFQRLVNISKTAHHSLLGPSFLNSSHKNTSKMNKRAALLDQYCTLILVHVDCVFYGLSSIFKEMHMRGILNASYHVTDKPADQHTEKAYYSVASP